MALVELWFLDCKCPHLHGTTPDFYQKERQNVALFLPELQITAEGSRMRQNMELCGSFLLHVLTLYASTA